MIFGITNSGGENVNAGGPTNRSSVDCETFSAAGVTNVDGDVDADDVSLKGVTNVGGDVTVDSFVSKGTTKITGALDADDATAKGTTAIDGDVKVTTLDVKGSARFGDVSADSFSAKGALTLADLSAEEVEIRGTVEATTVDAEELFIELGDDESTVETIDATTVTVERDRERHDGRLKVGRVSGDTVSIEHTIADEVIGETVSLGPGAHVGVVRAEELNVDERATVERTEERE